MPSKSTIYILSTVAIVAGVGKLIAENASNHFAQEAGKHLNDVAVSVIKKYPDGFEISPSQLRSVHNSYTRLDASCFFTDEAPIQDILKACSMLGYTLVDIHAKLRNKEKKTLIGNVIDALSKAHHFFAPVNEDAQTFKLYEEGARYAELWRNAIS